MSIKTYRKANTIESTIDYQTLTIDVSSDNQNTPSVEILHAKRISYQMPSAMEGVGPTVTTQVSNDGTNWANVPVRDGNEAAAASHVANGVVSCPVLTSNFRYMRLRASDAQTTDRDFTVVLKH